MAFSGGREPRNKTRGGVHVAPRAPTKGTRFRSRGHKAQAKKAYVQKPKNEGAPSAPPQTT